MDNTTQSKVVFLYRAVGGILAGVSLLVCAFALYLSCMKIPRMNEIFMDFDLTLPAMTKLFLNCPWLVLPFPAIAFLSGIMSAATTKRFYLILCGLTLLVAIAGTLLALIAIELPMLKLITSVNSG